MLLVPGIGATGNAGSQPAGYHIVRDCQEEWLIYSPEYKNYVPYVRAIHESEPSVSILLNLVQDRHFQFLLKTDRNAFLFINGALQRDILSDAWVSLSCDSLLRKYGDNEVILTIFGLRGLEGVSSFMAFPRGGAAGSSEDVLAASLVSLKPRQTDFFRDFSVIGSLLILLVGAIVFLTAPALAFRLTSLVAFFSRDFRSEIYHHYRAYSPPIVVATLGLALITSFFLLVTETYVGYGMPSLSGIADADSVWSMTVDYLKVTVVCFVLFYLKYFLISVTLRIINMGGLAHIHFIKSIQSSILFYGFVSVVLLMLAIQDAQLLAGVGEVLLWSIIVYYCVRLLVLYIILKQPGRFINLYLISYLCVVELIPLVIGIKFVM